VTSGDWKIRPEGKLAPLDLYPFFRVLLLATGQETTLWATAQFGSAPRASSLPPNADSPASRSAGCCAEALVFLSTARHLHAQSKELGKLSLDFCCVSSVGYTAWLVACPFPSSKPVTSPSFLPSCTQKQSNSQRWSVAAEPKETAMWVCIVLGGFCLIFEWDFGW
jgi:hypothetical protein